MNQEFLTYAGASALAGLVAGLVIGIIIRGARARRVIESMNTQLNQLQEQLSMAAKKVDPAPAIEKPQRWTGTEMAAIIGAIGTLLGVANAIYASYDGTSKAKLEQELGATRASLQELTSDMNDLLRYDTKKWVSLTPQDPPPPPAKKKAVAEFGIDDKRISAFECDNSKISLVFYGGGPSRLNCKKGGLRLQLNSDARLLIFPPEVRSGG